MNRYVGPERRRVRRRVDGPAGDEPPEIEPAHIARVLRCPRCRYTLSTMRRWRLICSECGHEWEEESNRSFADKLSDMRSTLGEYVLMAVMWCGLLAGLAFLLGLPLILLYIVSNAAGWTTGVTIVAAVVLVAVGLGVALAVWRSDDSALRRMRGMGRGDETRFR